MTMPFWLASLPSFLPSFPISILWNRRERSLPFRGLRTSYTFPHSFFRFLLLFLPTEYMYILVYDINVSISFDVCNTKSLSSCIKYFMYTISHRTRVSYITKWYNMQCNTKFSCLSMSGTCCTTRIAYSVSFRYGTIVTVSLNKMIGGWAGLKKWNICLICPWNNDFLRLYTARTGSTYSYIYC